MQRVPLTLIFAGLGLPASDPWAQTAPDFDVTGTERDDDGVLPFAHNSIHPCVELSGTLQQGFECMPVFVAGDVFVLENLDGHEVGESFCVPSAITACESVCPLPCLSANITHDCTR